MAIAGWKQLLAGHPWFKGDGDYPIPAYSEFMPAPRLGRKPCGTLDTLLFDEADPWGWHVTEYEEAMELRPGLAHLAHQLVGCLVHLGHGLPAQGIARAKLVDNPYWPPELAEHAGKLNHERFVVMMPLALSRTQDDKGRVRWTLFGGSEQGPSWAFWNGFRTAPDAELPEQQAVDFFRRLLQAAYQESDRDLHQAGFRILETGIPVGNKAHWPQAPLPSWTANFLWSKDEPVHAVRYLLTFQPFMHLPAEVKQAYLGGQLHLLPFPGSLVFWGAQPYLELRRELPQATQIPLQHSVARREGWLGLRVAQSGWLHVPRAGDTGPGDRFGPVRNTYKRTHRWARVLRHEDELAVVAREDTLAKVLFSVMPDDIRLYGKPMARNVQLWTSEFHELLDGPHADRAQLERAAHILAEGGLFGYRFQFPAMRVGRHEVYWHRPLVAYLSPDSAQATVLAEAPLGCLTAYRLKERQRKVPTSGPDCPEPITLWPRLLERESHLEAISLFDPKHDKHPYRTTMNVRKLLDTKRLLGDRPLPRSLAQRLLTLSGHETLDKWLDALPGHACDGPRCENLVSELRASIEAPSLAQKPDAKLPQPLTYHHTHKRSFEVAYWKHIAELAEGRYLNKNNADCVHEPVTRMVLDYPRRDLEALGDHLLAHYSKATAAAGMKGKALVGDLPFRWQTEFDYSWFGGWPENQEGESMERDLIVVIPGKDRRRAVIMADHYDTAFMEDDYEKEQGGSGARLSAAGADDNHSATVALMLGAPIFLELSQAGRLACDIWLVHLTGEEFPADCLGARHLCQCLVEGNLKMRLHGEQVTPARSAKRGIKARPRFHDLSRVMVEGVYVLDMVAHNNDGKPDIFQIAPGSGAGSMKLACHAHIANEVWNASAAIWNAGPGRKGCQRGKRSPSGNKVPAKALHPVLAGEVRPPYDPRSTLYNTDGQIFSDCGVPVVLFMENYDINRVGYHDTRDTMENIDLDYGAAVSAIAIESVARAAASSLEQAEAR